jgi:hypothetical protein
MAEFDVGALLLVSPISLLAEALAFVCQPRLEESGVAELVLQTADDVVGTDTMGFVDGCNNRDGVDKISSEPGLAIFSRR